MLFTLVVATATAHAGCDTATTQKLVAAVRDVPSDVQAYTAAAGLAQVCDAPAGLLNGAAKLPLAAPDLQPSADLRVAFDEPTAWMAVCAAGLEPLSELTALATDARRDHLWNRCELERLGWFSRAQWNQAEGWVVVPLLAGRALADAGIPHDQVEFLVRTLAGLPENQPILQLIGTSGQTGSSSLMDELFGDVGAPATGDLEAAFAEPLSAGDSAAGFAPDGRVEPAWRAAARQQGGSCEVEIHVTAKASVRDLTFIDCDTALRDDVRAAVEASTLSARRGIGGPVPGRFRATYSVSTTR